MHSISVSEALEKAKVENETLRLKNDAEDLILRRKKIDNDQQERVAAREASLKATQTAHEKDVMNLKLLTQWSAGKPQ